MGEGEGKDVPRQPEESSNGRHPERTARDRADSAHPAIPGADRTKALEQALEAIEDLEADQQSRNSLVQECLGLDLQPLGDANQVKAGEVADAPLDPRDVDAGDAARLGEVGLGEARLHGSMRQGSRLATRARFSGTRTWERPAGI